jgi:hypothetical protein
MAAVVGSPTVGLGGDGASGPAQDTPMAGGGVAGVESQGAAGSATAGNGGAAGSGVVVGNGGAAGSGVVVGNGGAAGSGAVVGNGGTAGSPGSGPGCSDGCAELSVPFDTWNSGEYFEIYLNGATDLSDAVISVRARKVSGKAGGLLIVVKDGADQDYAYAQSDWYAISEMTSEFATYTLDVAAPSATDENATFTPTAVQIISIQLAAGDTWYTDDAMTTEDTTALMNPTVVQIDEISVSGTGTLPGPWAFTGSVSDLKPNLDQTALDADPPYAVAGSTVTFVGPE